MRPLLLPGTHLLRRRSGHQAGLDHELAASPGGLTPGWADDPAAVAALVARGLALPDDHALRAALPPADGDPWPRHAVAALARRTPDRLPEAVAGRSDHLVRVTPFGHPRARELAEDLAGLVRRSGLRLPPARPRPGPPRRGAAPSRAVHVLVGIGEPPRELVDDHRREGIPHLVVRLTEGRAVVGPFVVPGRSACLRCIDCHRSAEDPSWPLLVEQYARASAHDRPDGIPEPVDPALAAVALGWAARDLASYVEGGDPTTLSATLALHPTLAELARQPWPPHPHCGCAWQ
ncbi:TOMM precursor leader peptide-binding protein [Nocardioides caldifontis]|uniref:TOMM precursor leader peptide-binding protein n=1 Tax=Nocardioides caldifontis TaxID=2588938 RepID=UPI0011DFC026|nr:TOMM precursor leader peptide-binding protein [Nocardioides caldifontis]